MKQKYTIGEVVICSKAHGERAALNLLTDCGPDGFGGTRAEYDALKDLLERAEVALLPIG